MKRIFLKISDFLENHPFTSIIGLILPTITITFGITSYILSSKHNIELREQAIRNSIEIESYEKILSNDIENSNNILFELASQAKIKSEDIFIRSGTGHFIIDNSVFTDFIFDINEWEIHKDTEYNFAIQNNPNYILDVYNNYQDFNTFIFMLSASKNFSIIEFIKKDSRFESTVYYWFDILSSSEKKEFLTKISIEEISLDDIIGVSHQDYLNSYEEIWVKSPELFPEGYELLDKGALEKLSSSLQKIFFSRSAYNFWTNYIIDLNLSKDDSMKIRNIAYQDDVLLVIGHYTKTPGILDDLRITVFCVNLLYFLNDRIILIEFNQPVRTGDKFDTGLFYRFIKSINVLEK